MISAIILAAGLSKRMKLGNKLLLEKNNIPIINMTLERVVDSKVNEIINVGGGKGYTVYEIIKCVKKITNLDLKIDVTKRRRGDPDILVSDINKSKNILSWEPKYSDVEQVISDSWEWYKYYKTLSQS